MGEDQSFVSSIGEVKNKNDILIGWKNREKQQAGFTSKISTTQKGEAAKAIYTDGLGHSATVAATGRGKTVMLISRLLRCPQSSIIIDIKGELYNVTNRYRREKMGHEIILYDPTHAIHGNVERASFNPLDIFDVVGGDIEDFAGDILSIIFDPSNRSKRDPYWDNSGENYARGLLIDVLARERKENCNLVTLWERVYGELNDIAIITDKAVNEKVNRPIFKRVVSLLGNFLELPDITRGGVKSTGQQHFNWLSSELVAKSLRNTSFDLKAIYNGKPFTMYIVVPPYKLHKLLPLIRLLLHVLTLMLFQRPQARNNPVRLIVDEAGVIDRLDILQSLTALGRGYSLYVDLIFQDISQLKEAYEKGWKTLLGNCRYQHYFGFNSYEDAETIGKRTGFSADYLLEMNKDRDLMLFVENGIGEIVRKVNYLRDTKEFEGRFDSNPFYM